MTGLNAQQLQLLSRASEYFIGHQGALGVMILPGGGAPIFLKSGVDGGPWGGTHRGGFPRGEGWAFTQGGPSQGNISTHVEGHAVAVLWQRKLLSAILLVDRPMCKICGRNLPLTLPPGAMLTVISEEEGTTIIRSSHGA